MPEGDVPLAGSVQTHPYETRGQPSSIPRPTQNALPAIGILPDFHFSFGSANHRVDSDAFIYAGLEAFKALRRSTPNG